MRTDTTHYGGVINNILLPGTILLANIDVTGLLEYALKALAGGAIWLGYKLAADRIERGRNRKAQPRSKKSQSIKKNSKNVGE